jgi:hypothetical protein
MADGSFRVAGLPGRTMCAFKDSFGRWDVHLYRITPE